MVECSTSYDCTTNGTMMSAEECCVHNTNGLAYTIAGQEECHVCIGKDKLDLQKISVSIIACELLFSIWMDSRRIHWKRTGSEPLGASWLQKGCRICE